MKKSFLFGTITIIPNDEKLDEGINDIQIST